MKKVWLIAHRNDQSKVVGALQQAGLIEVGEVEATGHLSHGSDAALFASRAEQITLELTKVQFVLDFLKKAKPPKKGLISSLVTDRLSVKMAAFKDIDSKLDFEQIYIKCEEYNNTLLALNSEAHQLKVERADVGCWLGLDARFDEVRPTHKVDFAFGRIKKTDLPVLEAALADACREAEIGFVNQDGPRASMIIIFYKPHQTAVDRALAGAGFERASIAPWSSTPKEELIRIDRRLNDIEDERSELKKAIQDLLPLEEDVIILRDWLKARRSRYEAQSKFGCTASTFVIQGWVEAARADVISERLAAQSAIVDFSFSDPDPGDSVPTVLQNPKWLRPFEVLTRLYGVPNYHELDPTPTMGIFFFIFFGIALGDVGYGLVLALACLWFKKRLLLSEIGRLWLDLFAMGGLSAMIFGALTGSYFGLDTGSLPVFLKRLMIIDPLNQAFIFLIITWVIGIIHILTGLVLELLDSWRNRDYSTAVYNNLSLIVLFISAVAALAGWIATAVFAAKGPFYTGLLSVGVKALGMAAVVYVLASGGFISEFLQTAGRLARRRPYSGLKESPASDMIAAAAVLLVVLALTVGLDLVALMPISLAAVVGALFASPATRRAFGNLGSGLYNLYGMSSFIGDILSYSRLMALGLATFLIGFVINTLAGLVAGFSLFGLPLGILLALAIAIPLHIVNLVINLLGAFVHPLRLQFVEFFSKFYEDGGKAFRPLAFEAEHLVFKED